MAKNLKKQSSGEKSSKTDMDRILNVWREEVNSLSYEESLQALDLLLQQLQNDDIPVEELQKNYLHGKIYLEHCENLLNKIEHTVIQLDPETLQPDTEKLDAYS